MVILTNIDIFILLRILTRCVEKIEILKLS